MISIKNINIKAITLTASLPDPLHCRLWCVSLRSSSRWLHIELPWADSVSFHVCGEGSVHPFVFWSHHRQSETGSSILKNLHLVVIIRPDALAIFKPSNLPQGLEVSETCLNLALWLSSLQYIFPTRRFYQKSPKKHLLKDSSPLGVEIQTSCSGRWHSFPPWFYSF